MSEKEEMSEGGAKRTEGVREIDSTREIESLDHAGKYITQLDKAQYVLVSEKIEQLNITPSQLPILMGLYNEDGVSQQHLADLYDLNKSVVTKTIDKLAGKGFIYRSVDPDDRRSNLIYLTEKGERFRVILISILEEKEDAMFRGISREERAEFKRLLKKTLRHVREELSG